MHAKALNPNIYGTFTNISRFLSLYYRKSNNNRIYEDN